MFCKVSEHSESLLIDKLQTGFLDLFETRRTLLFGIELEKDYKSFGYNAIYFELVHL